MNIEYSSVFTLVCLEYWTLFTHLAYSLYSSYELNLSYIKYLLCNSLGSLVCVRIYIYTTFVHYIMYIELIVLLLLLFSLFPLCSRMLRMRDFDLIHCSLISNGFFIVVVVVVFFISLGCMRTLRFVCLVTNENTIVLHIIVCA